MILLELLLRYSLLSILSILYMIIFHICVKSHALKIGLSDRYLWLISMNVYILHYIGSAFFTHGRKTSLVIFNVELQMEHECFISNHRKMLGEDNNTINIKASINSSQTRNVRSTNLKSKATKLYLQNEEVVVFALPYMQYITNIYYAARFKFTIIINIR